MTTTKELIYGIPLKELPQYRRAEPVGTKFVPASDEVNIELLEEILEFIKAHPKSWRQESWYKIVDTETGREKYSISVEDVSEKNSCGAAFCFAGHVALAKGFPAPPLDNDSEWTRKVIFSDGEWDWRTETVSEFARKQLGLDEIQAAALFDASNEIYDLENLVNALKLNPELSGWHLDELRYEFDELATDEELQKFIRTRV